MGKLADRSQSVGEYIISLVFIFGGISVAFSEPLIGATGILALLSSKVAALVYSFFFTLEGMILLLGKALKMKRLHKNILMVMYLTTIFTFFLEFAIIGWSWYLLDSPIVGGLCAMFWLRWKIKTEYITVDEFDKDIAELTQKHQKIEGL